MWIPAVAGPDNGLNYMIAGSVADLVLPTNIDLEFGVVAEGMICKILHVISVESGHIA